MGLDERTPYHVTLRVRRGIDSLRTYRVVREIEASFRKACERGKFRLVQTWFLRKGWRLHGLLDPNEIPGGLAM